jgi:predicted nucleotidyltransferase
MNAPTSVPELNDVLLELISSIQKILGTHFLAAYLQGSFALGDWDLHSDVDFLIVLQNEMPDSLLPELQAMHQRIYTLPSVWAQHLEGSYISQKVLHDNITSLPLWYLDNGSRELILDTHCNTLVTRQTTREHGITLAGVNAKTLIELVPTDQLKLEVRAVMREWGASILESPSKISTRWYQQFAVISYCRMLETLRTGQIKSKRSAAIWGQQHLESRWHHLIATAWQEHAKQRENYKVLADPEEVSQTLEFICYALEHELVYR